MLAALDAQVASAKEFLRAAKEAKLAAATLILHAKPGRPSSAAQLGKLAPVPAGGTLHHFFKPAPASIFLAPPPPLPVAHISEPLPGSVEPVPTAAAGPAAKPGRRARKVARTDGVETAGGLGAPPPPHVPGTDDSDSSEPTQSDGAGEGSSGASSCDEGKTAGVDRESEPLLYAVVEKFKTLCLAPPSSVHSTRDSDPESDAPAGAGSGVASLISSSCLWLK